VYVVVLVVGVAHGSECSGSNLFLSSCNSLYKIKFTSTIDFDMMHPQNIHVGDVTTYYDCVSISSSHKFSTKIWP
jgi:hypothetical protein